VSEGNGKAVAEAPSRKVALLGMPGYGNLSAGAARGFFNACDGKSLALSLKLQGSSLLAHNFNILWAWALNESRKGPVDYFAMQHSDIEPEDYWLDKLTAEMEARDLDILGVVVPIKDMRGVTSIAVGRQDGSNWRVGHRLTLREVYRLPETFTSADVGGPLLLNTGLWVCRFREEWAKEVHFEINDRIVFDTKSETYVPEVEPEDWYFSRLLHELGLKVGCTRKIPLGHRGDMVFGNTRGWGEYDFDREYLTESALPHSFPHDVVGWLSEGEGAELTRLAAGKNVLEIGSYCGRSTICLARFARSVGAVDTFDGRGTELGGDTEKVFRDNLHRYGVDRRVNVLKGAADRVIPNLPQIFDLVFIDGSHDYESVKADIALSLSVLKPGGLLAFHDYERDCDPGVTAAVNEFLSGGAELLGRTESLAVVRPRADVLSTVGG